MSIGERKRKHVKNLEQQVQHTIIPFDTVAGVDSSVAMSLSPMPDNFDASWFLNTPQPTASPGRLASCQASGSEDLSWIDATFDAERSTTTNVIDPFQDLQRLETSQFSFPDEAAIDVPVQQTFTAGWNICTMLGVEQYIWDPTYLGVFNRERILTTTTLPANLEPTDVQLRMPHHPLFDILPWPSVRTKLITAFSLPPACRPPAARDPLAVMNMIYDIDDEAEGIRVRGGNGMDGDNWEIGQAFFDKWWWALDRAVVEQSNRSRRNRGAKLLEMPSPQ